MTLDYENSSGELEIRLCGELGHPEAIFVMQRIRELIDSKLPHKVVLDMKQVDFMDSSGIAVVMQGNRNCLECDAEFSVINVRPQPYRVFSTSGISGIIKMQREEI